MLGDGDVVFEDPIMVGQRAVELYGGNPLTGGNRSAASGMLVLLGGCYPSEPAAGPSHLTVSSTEVPSPRPALQSTAHRLGFREKRPQARRRSKYIHSFVRFPRPDCAFNL